MKRLIILMILPVMILSVCSKEQKEFKLEQGTPAYQGKCLRDVFSNLNPGIFN